MTPGANDLYVFAVKRGNLSGRFDVQNLMYIQYHDRGTNCKRLGDLTSEEPCYGTSAAAIERTNESQPKYIRITDFDDFGIEKNHRFVTAENYSNKHILKKGDILFARTGATVGKTYYYDGSIGESVFAGYCIRFRFDNKKVSPKFVYWYTKTGAFANWVKGIQRPSGQPNINKEEYKSFEIYLPERGKQEKLCAVLDIAETNRKRKLEQASEMVFGNSIYLMESLGLSFDFSNSEHLVYATTRSSMFGRLDADYYSPKFVHFRNLIEKLPYPIVSVEEISKRIISGFAAGKQDQADDLPDNQRVPHLRPFSITSEGELSFETQKFVPRARLKNTDYCQKGEVIFNNTNSPDLVGKTAVFDSDILCAASNHMTRIMVKEGVNPYYIAALFNMLLQIGYWKLLCTNFNNQAGVNTEVLKAVRIPLPDKSIQDQIVAEIRKRYSTAHFLRQEAIKEWDTAKSNFEKDLIEEGRK